MFRKNLINFLIISLLLVFPAIGFAKKNKNISKSLLVNKSRVSSPRQNELLVIGTLKSLYIAQANYFLTHYVNGFEGFRLFGNAQELYLADLIDGHLAKGEKYGYNFTIERNDDSNVPRFQIFAKPKSYRKTGIRSFYIDATCKVRGGDKNGLDATVEDTEIDNCVPTLAYENERQTILAMRWVASAQETYRATIGIIRYGTLADLNDAGLINNWFGTGSYHNYSYSVGYNPQYKDYPSTFRVWANPSTMYGQMGFRSFFIDQTGVLRGADHQGASASVSDPPITE